MDMPPNPPLVSIRKAVARTSSHIENCKNVRPHHRVTLQALRVAEALLENGFDLDRVRLAIEATAEGRGCSPSVSVTDQHIASPLVHGPTMERNDAKRHIAER